MKKYVICNNIVDDCDLEEAMHWLSENYEDVDVEDDVVYQEALDEKSAWLDCECENLNIPLSHPIIVLADLDLWTGHHMGYKMIGANVNQIFEVVQGDFWEFYADAYNVKCRDSHHDGTNEYTFREFIGSDAMLDELQYEIACKSESERDMNRIKYLVRRYTRSLRHYVADTYGWTSVSA